MGVIRWIEDDHTDAMGFLGKLRRISPDCGSPAAGKTVDDYKEISWMNPARGHIHPVQEIAAFAEAVRNGFTSRKKGAASSGEYIEEIDAENARDQERAKILGLQYGAYPALKGMDFGTVLAGSQLEDAQQEAASQTPNGVIAQPDWSVNKPFDAGQKNHI